MDNGIDSDVREEYAKHGSIFKTAKKLKVEATYVKDVVDQIPKAIKIDTTQCRWEGFGDPTKKAYYVARMPAVEVWDNEIPEVAEARAAFEAGTHYLGTGRDGPYIILYCFPQITKTPRPGYFNLTAEA